jgi:hypothetical protein
MSTSILWMSCAVCLLTSSLAVSRLFAGEPSSPARPRTDSHGIIDLLLGRGGSLEGQLKDAGGQLADGAELSIWQGQKLIWKGPVDQAGKFHLKNLTTGIYRVVYGEQSILCRAWANEDAPPKAQGSLVLKTEKPVTGTAAEVQRRSLNPFSTGLSIPSLWGGTRHEVRSPVKP